MKKIFLLIVMAVCALSVSAQNTKTVTGAVIDKNGNPLPNALVRATGGAETVTTDADGSFTIEVPIWLKSLTAEYAGLSEKTIGVRNKSNVLFKMKNRSQWFLNAVYGVTLASGYSEMTAHNFGLMAGFLKNWGGYMKVTVPAVLTTGPDAYNIHEYIDYIPSISLGITKKIAKPLYIYAGAGYGDILCDELWSYSEYGDEIDWYSTAGAIFDAGVMYKVNKRINVTAGYTLGTDFDGAPINHSIQFSAGFCF